MCIEVAGISGSRLPGADRNLQLDRMFAAAQKALCKAPRLDKVSIHAPRAWCGSRRIVSQPNTAHHQAGTRKPICEGI
jgi:hypothetical protein